MTSQNNSVTNMRVYFIQPRRCWTFAAVFTFEWLLRCLDVSSLQLGRCEVERISV